MGVRGWRSELSWSESEDGTINWSNYDKLFAAAKKDGLPDDDHPGRLAVLVPALRRSHAGRRMAPASQGYSGTGDWLLKPTLYPRYGAWIEAFVRRYWENGKGGLWGVENYNEPWGRRRHLRLGQRYSPLSGIAKLIATSVKKVRSRHPHLCGVLDHEYGDKFYSDGSSENGQVYRCLTDHYVMPANCYGPGGQGAWQDEHGYRDVVCELRVFAAPRRRRVFGLGSNPPFTVAPQHAFDGVPGVPDQYFIPAPLVVATAAFNQMVTGRPFEKMVFQDHLPLAFQFGRDDDKDSLVILFGRLMPIGSQVFGR